MHMEVSASQDSGGQLQTEGLQAAASGSDRLPAPGMGPPGLGTDVQGSTPNLVPAMLAHQTFEIAREDCEGGLMIAPPAGTLPPQPWGALCKEVFVQDAKSTSRFKSVPIDRARRACSFEARCDDMGGGAYVPAGREPGIAMDISHLATCGIFPVDEDAVYLRTWESRDADIYELLRRGHRCEANVVVAVFACQMFLAGLTLPSGLLLFRGDSDLFRAAMSAIQPGLGSFTLFLAEVACMGSFLRVAGSYRQATAAPALGITALDGRKVLRRLLRDTLHAVVGGLLVVVCLFNGRCNSLLWGDAWPEGFARQLIALQTMLGLVGLVLALPEASGALVSSARSHGKGAPDRGGRQSGSGGDSSRLTKR
mmetsp:Transcript_86440/g.185276  ORF Transcript_86440/g.185276 Transcript_86440/m.185276 type:complete len:367 (-) Transcript_86440:209-1309(-)